MSRDYDLIDTQMADRDRDAASLSLAGILNEFDRARGEKLHSPKAPDRRTDNSANSSTAEAQNDAQADESHLTYAISGQASEGAAYEQVSSIRTVTLLNTLDVETAKASSTEQQQSDAPYYSDADALTSDSKYTLHYRASSGDYATAYPDDQFTVETRKRAASVGVNQQPDGSSQHYADARSRLLNELPGKMANPSIRKAIPETSTSTLAECREEIAQLRLALRDKETRNGELERELGRLHARYSALNASDSPSRTADADSTSRTAAVPNGDAASMAANAHAKTGKYRFAVRVGELPSPKEPEAAGGRQPEAAKLRTYTEIVTEFLALADHVVHVLGEAKGSFFRRKKLVKKLHDTVSNVRDAVRLRLTREQKSRSLPALDQLS